MLHDRQQLDVRVTEFLHVGNELLGKFAVAQPAIASSGCGASRRGGLRRSRSAFPATDCSCASLSSRRQPTCVELDEGAIYNMHEIIGPRGDMLPLKADPYAFRAELRPNTGSIVSRLDTHKWADGDWITKRKTTPWLEKPISIYEVHLGKGWRRNPDEGNRWLSYRELAEQPDSPM